MPQKKMPISEELVHRIISETTKNCKQVIDDELEIRVKAEVKKEVQRLFRELGRM